MPGAAKDPVTGLTFQQDAWSRAVALAGLNESDAYRATYHPSPNCQPTTINEEASRLAHNPLIAARIAELKASLEAKTVTDAAAILTELKTIGMAAVSGPVRAADKVAALDKMAKVLGLYKEDRRNDERRPAITHITVVLSHGGQEDRVIEGVIGSIPMPEPDHDEKTTFDPPAE